MEKNFRRAGTCPARAWCVATLLVCRCWSGTPMARLRGSGRSASSRCAAMGRQMKEFVGRAGLPARDRSVCNDLRPGSLQSRILLLIAFLLFFYLSMLFVSHAAMNFHIAV